MEYIVTTTTMTVHPKDKHPVYGEDITRVSLSSDGADSYLVLEQEGRKIRVDPDELEKILVVARKLIEGVKDYDTRD
jgi:hypothetical protein